MSIATDFLHQNIVDQMLELEDEVEDFEPTDKELREIHASKESLEIAWCGGSKRRGCGKTFNLYTVKYVDGYAICPHCGKFN